MKKAAHQRDGAQPGIETEPAEIVGDGLFGIVDDHGEQAARLIHHPLADTGAHFGQGLVALSSPCQRHRSSQFGQLGLRRLSQPSELRLDRRVATLGAHKLGQTTGGARLGLQDRAADRNPAGQQVTALAGFGVEQRLQLARGGCAGPHAPAARRRTNRWSPRPARSRCR